MSRKGDWFQTYTGKKFWPLDPRPEDVDIIDIAHSLSLTCRFNGHCEQFYSVADHSLWVEYVFYNIVKEREPKVEMPPEFIFLKSPLARLCALLHDAAEAYIGDIIRPLKRSVPAFKKLEEPIHEAILERFVNISMHPVVHNWIREADMIMLLTEKRDVVCDGPGTRKELGEWQGEEVFRPIETTIHPRDAKVAESLFLNTFYDLRSIASRCA